jgi:hypothetical protein
MLEDGKDQDDTREHDVKAGGNKPLVVTAIGEIDVATIVGKVGQNDTNVDGTSEETGAETTDGCGRNLSNVDRSMEQNVRREVALKASFQEYLPDDRSLANTKASDESTGIDGS